MKPIYGTIVGLLLFIGVILITIQIYNHQEKRSKDLKEAVESITELSAEYAYFEGQKDAIEGDVRIEFDKGTNSYKWIKSPWDNSDKPISELYLPKQEEEL